jgi:hypothetical protein
MIEFYRKLLHSKRTKLDKAILLELEGRTVNPPGNISYLLADVKALEELISKSETLDANYSNL